MDWKKCAKKLILPPSRLILLLTVLSAVCLTAVFRKGLEDTAFAHIAYLLSFYTLTAVCVCAWTGLPKLIRAVRQKILDHPLGNRYLTDAAFKIHISLYGSLAANLLYAAVKLIAGLRSRSIWPVTLAAYYMILAVMRFLLLRFIGRVGIGRDRYAELRRSRQCGIILMLINIVLSGVVILVVRKNHSFYYNGMMIYAMAAYTFYVTAQAIISTVKFRRYNSPVMSAAKRISLSAALVSMLSLETAMLHAFGEGMAVREQQLMTIFTGSGVAVAIVAISVYTIVRSTKEMKGIRRY